jgi:hypothetical protein
MMILSNFIHSDARTVHKQEFLQNESNWIQWLTQKTTSHSLQNRSPIEIFRYLALYISRLWMTNLIHSAIHKF